MKLCSSILGAALLAASTLSFAQAPGGAPTDAQKQERRAKMKAAYGEAEKACQGKQGDERRQCMSQSMCAKAPNPQQCQERAAKMKSRHEEHCKADPAKCEAEKKARMEKRAQVREACKGKQGDDLKSCIREQRGKK